MNITNHSSTIKIPTSRLVACLLCLYIISAALPASAAPTFAVGDVFIGINNSQIQWRHGDGTLVGVLTVPSTAATVNGANTGGMAFDSAGNLYVTMFASETVAVFDKTGTFLHTFGSGYNSDPESICFDSAGNAYVGQADGTHRILKFSPAGALLSSSLPTTEDRGTDWVDISGDQCTVYYTSEGSNVLAFNVCTATQLPKFTAANLPGQAAYEHRLRPNGEILVADTEGIIRLNAAGVVIQTYNYNVTNNFFALNLDPDGTSFWTADIVNFYVYKFDIASGAQLLKFKVLPNSVVSGLVVYGELTAGTATLELTKSCPATNGIPGGVIGFTGTITNTGTAPVTNVVVVNNQPTNNTPVITIPRLDPGTGTNFSGTEPVPTNVCVMPDTLTATGFNTNGAPVTPATASANCPVTTIPALSLIKNCPATNGVPGGVIGWTGSVTNVGNVSVTNVIIANTLCNETSGQSDAIYVNATTDSVEGQPGATITMTNIILPESNHEYVPAFLGPVGVPDRAVVFLESAGSTNVSDIIWVHNQFFYFASDPSLTNFPPGIPIVATLVENGGIQDVSPYFALPPNTVAVQSDVEAPPSTVTIISRLDPGQGATFSGQERVPTNGVCSMCDTLTATARDVCGNPVSANASANCSVQTSSALFIEKFCVGTNHPGGTLQWLGFVQNAGNTPITNVVIVNNQPSNNTPVTIIASLQPGQGTNFGGSYPIPPITCSNGSCSISDTLTGTGTDVCGNLVTASTNHTCPIQTDPQIAVTQVPPISTCAGGGATFTGQVSNTGDVPLSVTLEQIVFDSAGHQQKVAIFTNFPCVNPGEAKDWTATYETSASDCSNSPLTNSILAAGTNLCDSRLVASLVSTQFSVGCAQITLAKGIGCVVGVPNSNGVSLVCATANGNFVKEAFGVKSDGQDPAFCYQLEVTNGGGCVLVNVTLDDEQVGLTNLLIGTLAPGDSFVTNLLKSWSETTTNVATVTAQSASDATTNGTVSATDFAIAHVRTASLIATELVSVNRSTPSTSYTETNCGAVATNITWYALLTNNGEADLVNVTITSDPLAGDILPCGNIAATASNLPVGGSTLVTLCSVGYSNCVALSIHHFIDVSASVDSEGTNCVWDITGTNITVNVMTSSTLSLCCSTAGKKPGCRVTGGGKQDMTCPAVRYVTHGGQVGAPVGQDSCTLGTNLSALHFGNPCIRGRWTHVRHVDGGLDGNLYARFFDTLACACLGDGEGSPDETGHYSPGVVTNGICNPDDSSVGPGHPAAPANKIAFTGRGDWSDLSEPRPAFFRVDIEDRGEGRGHHGGSSLPDRYRIRIWVLTDLERQELQDGTGPDPFLQSFRAAIAACNGIDYLDGVTSDNYANSCGPGQALLLFPGAGSPVRLPDIDDGGALQKGNEQIHPAEINCGPAR